MRLTTGILSGSFEKVDPLEEVYKQINPWTGFFTEEGVFETLKVGFENTGKMTTAQVLANNFTVVNEADAELVLDVLYSVGKEVAKIVASYLTGGTPKHALARCEAEAREEALVIRADELVARQRDEIDPLVQRLLAIGDDPDFEFQREQLVRQIDERRRSLGLETIGAELAALSVDAAELRERSEEAENDVAEASLLIAASRVEMEARNRRRDAADASDAEAAAAQLGAAAGSFAKLHAETVGVADLKDVLDDDHPAKFKEHLLRPELDIDTVRRALKRAKKNEPDRASEIDAIAKEIDQHRIEKVQELINEFMKSSGLADQVVAIVQGGAAEGNPEYQGIFGDIDFTLFVTPDATAEETARKTKIIKDRILAFFRDKDFPLATQEESSHMDAEAFVQAVGVMDVATSADGDLIVDTAIKRADVTRFYSEGGGKWAANNYAFSGKKLWGNFDREWIQVKPREAYGLALDMARHLGFLTDPRNAPEGLQRMSTEQKIEQLGGVLKDSKYFLRLVDAYLMGHEGLGNRLYNNRMHWRASSGEDASYHEQIAKDVEALVMPLGGEQGARLMEASADLEGRALEQARQSIFQQGDVDFIKQLARIKQKGENPDPWAVLPGSDAEAKAASAEALAAWMLHTAPKILAATAEVRQREQQRVMANGNTQEIRDLRNDTRRIATTVAAVSIYDAVGSRSLLHPPARMVEGQDEDGNPRVASQSLDRQQHETAIRQSIEAERRRRQRLHDEIVARQEAIRRQYPPNEALSDQDRQQLKAETQKVYVRVHGREQNLDEDRPGFWLLYWLPK